MKIQFHTTMRERRKNFPIRFSVFDFFEMESIHNVDGQGPAKRSEEQNILSQHALLMTSNQRVITTTTTTIIIIISHGPPRERSKKAPILWIIFGVLLARRPTCHFSFWGGGGTIDDARHFLDELFSVAFHYCLVLSTEDVLFFGPLPQEIRKSNLFGIETKRKCWGKFMKYYNKSRNFLSR